MSGTVGVRAATVEELPDVLNVLDAAVLDVDSGRLQSAIDRDDVLVAVAGEDESGDDTRVLGALVLSGEEITAVAVRRRRRGQGIGTRLVEAAAERRERLAAEFDADVTPFWSSLGFDYRPLEGHAGRQRYRGVRE